MLRLFVAVDLPPALRSNVKALMERVHNARWVNPEQLHITLRFMGDTPEDTLASIRESLARVKQDAFRLRLRGAGAFPEDRSGRSRKVPRVLWLGIEPAKELADLKRKVDDALDGASPRQVFSPHLTLARFPHSPDQTLASFLAERQHYCSPLWFVDCFHLYQSSLRRDGAIHTIVASYALAGAPQEDQT